MSADDVTMVKVRDLVAGSPVRLDGLRYHGEHEDFTEPRDSLMSLWPGSDFEHAYADEDGATLVLIPGTSWGDYGGSLCDRVSHAALVQDYPEHVVEIVGHYDSHSLYLVLDAEIPETLAEEVERLVEHGYLDDGDLLHEIEEEMFAADWSGWLGRDLRDDVKAALVGPDNDPEDADDLVPDEEALLSLVWETTAWQDGDATYVAETATSGYIEGADVLAEALADDIVRSWSERLTHPDQGVLL